MKKYKILANEIIEFIMEKNLKRGYKLPKVNEFQQTFGYGKSTVLQALTLLDQQGIIYKVQGSGVFVRRNPGDLKEYVALTENLGFYSNNQNVKTRVLKLEELRLPPKWAVEKGLPASPCYSVKRIRIKEDGPFVIEHSYYSQQSVPYLSREIVEGSIFSYIRQALGKDIRFSEKYMHVVKLTDEQAEFLQLEENDPALEIKEVFSLSDGQIFDVSRLVYNYKNSKFFSQSSDEILS